MARHSHSSRLGNRAEPVSDIVTSAEHGLARIADRAHRLEALQKALWPSIPKELRPHCTLANYRESTLVFSADSPVWASRLRQASAEILHSAQSNCKIQARRLEVRIDPVTKKKAPHPKRRRLNQAVSDLLCRAASTCPDRELADALQRFARRNRQEDES